MWPGLPAYDEFIHDGDARAGLDQSACHRGEPDDGVDTYRRFALRQSAFDIDAIGRLRPIGYERVRGQIVR